MLDLCELCLEGIERLFQADLSWEPVPDCPGKGHACIVFVCSQMAERALVISSLSTPMQVLILTNGNKTVSQLEEDIKSGDHSSCNKKSCILTVLDVHFSCILIR